MSGAPLSTGAWETLRALALGVRIREFADGWRAVGPWQEPSSSGISSPVIGELLGAGFVLRETLGLGCYLALTGGGSKALRDQKSREIRESIEWLREK